MRTGPSAACTALVLALCACHSTPPQAPVETARERLERALDAVQAETVQADIEFLADDELKGRDTPSRGLRVAARYLQNRVCQLGLEPGAEEGWYHFWTRYERTLDPERTRLELAEGDATSGLVLGSNFAVYPSEIVDGEWSGELVWCGSGSRRDLEGLELAGRWALCREKGESRTRRRRRAAEVGAAGVITIASPRDDESTASRFAGWTGRAGHSVLRDEVSNADRIPVYWIDEDAASALIPNGEPELGALLGASVVAATDAWQTVALENVCAFWPGAGPLADEVVLVSAHYDHIGERDGEIYNGADDNASGSAALLALADALAEHGPLARSVMLLWVSGEELGLLGSYAWAGEPWLPGDARAICNINMDMVGRNEPGLLEYTPSVDHPRHNHMATLVTELAALEGFDELRTVDRDFERSDHWAFADEMDLPVVYVSAGEHPDYHRASDTADKVDHDKVARFARLTLRLIAQLQEPSLEFHPEPVEVPAPVE